MKKIVLILLLLSMSLFSKNNMLQKHILVLHSYNKSMSWVANIDKAIDDILQPDKNNYILHREYMDTKRIFTKEYLQDLKKVYKNKYKNIKFDLILASDNNAFDFLRKNRDELFGNVPVSFCGVNYFKDSDLNGYTNYTGAAEIFDTKKTIQIALRLVPSIKNIYIVNDYTTTGKAWTKTIKEQLKGIDKNIIYVKNSSIEELKTKLSSLNPKKNMVLLGVYFKDKNGEYFTYEKIGKIIAKNSNAPVFSLLKFNLGNGGVVGGSVIGGYYQGTAMSKIAKKILNGTLVKNIPVQKDGATKFIFDYDALRKYNLDIKKLPKDAIILNKKISFFEEHKAPIMIITILIIIIIILLTNIRQRKKAQILLKQSQKVVEEQNKNLENEVKKRTQELEKQKESFEAMYNTSKDAIAILDMQSNFLTVNPAYIEMTGFTKEELLANSCFNLTVEKDIQPSKDAMQEVLKVGYIQNFEKDCKLKDDKVITINMSMSLLKNPNRILISARDVTQQKEMKKELKLLASIDSLTKLYNRRYFMETAKSILELAQRNKTKTSVIILDIDKFKRVNDVYGHQAGDNTLIALASSILSISRKSDIISRWGGEEFVLLLPNTDINGALIIAEKIRKTVQELVVSLENGQSLKFTVSLGTSAFNSKTDTNIEASIDRADKALYRAKESGRNRVCQN